MAVEDADSARYLASLNACFGGWGGERDESLVFHRPFEGLVPARFALAEDGEWLAGSAVSWRTIATAGGQPELIGIMTGSWTVPAARGRGCFAHIIQHSRALCAANGARWLLAFVTETNASRRQLERAGSAMVPSWYMWSPEGAAVPDTRSMQLQPVEVTDDLIAECHARQALQRQGANRFHYGSPELWRLQFIDRTLPTEMLRDPDLGVVVVEKHPEFDRLLTAIPDRPEMWQDLAVATWARALASGRRFFAYTTQASRHAGLTERCGLGGIAGFMTILPAEDGTAATLDIDGWAVESGDRL